MPFSIGFNRRRDGKQRKKLVARPEFLTKGVEAQHDGYHALRPDSGYAILYFRLRRPLNDCHNRYVTNCVGRM